MNNCEPSSLRAALCLTAVLLAAVPVACCAQRAEAGPPSSGGKTDPADRMDWWRAARFGMFIHWGLYAIPGGEWKGREYGGAGEWLMYHAHIPPDEYEPLARQFNPTKFDARRWVALAKHAGMKYLVVTTKHHDGFCLFDTPYTDYDVVDATPFGRDVIRELADECHRQGVRLGFYHSILDWHHPDYLPRRPWDPRPAETADFARYVEYLKNQVTVLLSNYGRVDVLWFDGQWEESWNEELGRELYHLVRRLQPAIIVNDRVGKGRLGDFKTPEQYIPPRGLPGVDWETCMTMNDTWGYVPRDRNWKSARRLIRMLVDTASKGGNFLLNVGPMPTGEIPRPSVERLEEIGKWLEHNGESIYGTSASPFRRLGFDGRCTVKGDRLYVHVFSWPPERELTLPGLRSEVRYVQHLTTLSADGDPPPALRSFPFERSDAGVTIHLPPEPLDPTDTVLLVQLATPPVVDDSVVPGIRPTADGRLLLPARLADVHGTRARLEIHGGIENIGYWTEASDWVSWPIELQTRGRFDVLLAQATPDNTAGSQFVISVADQELVGTVWATGSWTTVQTRRLGTLTLPAGKHELAVRVRKKPGYAVMNLVRIELRPVAEKGAD